MNGGILQQIVDEKAWEAFLAHRLMKGRFNWRSFQESDTYVGEQAAEHRKVIVIPLLNIPAAFVTIRTLPKWSRVKYLFLAQ